MPITETTSADARRDLAKKDVMGVNIGKKSQQENIIEAAE